MEALILLIIHLVEYVLRINKKNVTLTVFDMVTAINESKTLIKHFSCDFDGRKCCSKQRLINDKYQCECKKPIKQRTCKEYLQSEMFFYMLYILL